MEILILGCDELEYLCENSSIGETLIKIDLFQLF